METLKLKLLIYLIEKWKRWQVLEGMMGHCVQTDEGK